MNSPPVAASVNCDNYNVHSKKMHGSSSSDPSDEDSDAGSKLEDEHESSSSDPTDDDSDAGSKSEDDDPDASGIGHGQLTARWLNDALEKLSEFSRWLNDAREKLSEFSCFDPGDDEDEEEDKIALFREELLDDRKMSIIYDILRQLKNDQDNDNEENEDNEEGKEEAGEDGHDDDSEGHEYSGGAAFFFDREAQCNGGTTDEASEDGDPPDHPFINNLSEDDGNDRSIHRALDNTESNPDTDFLQEFINYLDGCEFDENSSTVPPVLFR